MTPPRLVRSLPILLLAALAAACAAEPKTATSPVQTSGSATATPPGETPVVDQTPLQKKREAVALDSDSAHTRSALELRVVTSLESADVQLDALRKRAQDATLPKDRAPIDKQIAEAQQGKRELYANLKQLHGDMNQSWEAFSNQVEENIAKLDEALGNQRQKRNVPAGGQPTQPTKKPAS